MVDILKDTSVEKADALPAGVMAGGGTLCLFHAVSAGSLSGLNPCRSFSCCHSLSVHMDISPVI